MVDIILSVVLVGMFFTNVVLMVRLRDTYERLNENLTDLEVIYIKYQQILREIKDIFQQNRN